MTPVEVTQSARLAASTLKTTWQGYLASGRNVALDVKAKVDVTLGAFQNLSDGRSTDMGPATLTGAVNDVLTACNAILVALPPVRYCPVLRHRT